MLDGIPEATVTFPAGVTETTLAVATDNDDVVEGDSDLTLTVLADTETPATYLDGASAVVSVTDDDTATLAFSVDETTITESGGETSTVTVAIDNNKTFARPQTIAISLGGTATPGNDFTWVDAQRRTFTKPYTLRLAAGASQVTGVITALDDRRVDAAETITVSASYQGTAVGSDTITITDDDAAPTLALDGLTITSTNARSAYPAFAAAIEHYAVGCASGDTVTITPTAPGGTRIAVEGSQVTSGNAVTLTGLEGDADIAILLSNASGQSRRYTVHCLPDDFPTVTVTDNGSTWDGLILGSVNMGMRSNADNRWTHLVVMDTNGVPRFQHTLRDIHVAHFRPQGGGRYPFGYLVTAPPEPNRLVLLNENLEVATEVTQARWSGRAGWSDAYLDVHDFLNLADGTSVIVIDDPVTRDLSGIGFGSYGTAESMVDEIILKVPRSGGATTLWNSKDHMELRDCTQHSFTGSAYSHFNSIELLSDGHYLLSLRGCAQIVKVHSGTGAVLWRISLTNLSAAQWEARTTSAVAPYTIVDDPEGEFCGQHAAKLTGNGNLLLYDNGNHCLIDPDTAASRADLEASRVLEYSLDHDQGEARFLRQHSLGGSGSTAFTPFTGLVAPMDNGNWWVSWGRTQTAAQAANVGQSMTEVNPDTGVELLHILYEDAGGTRQTSRSYPLREDEIPALAEQVEPLSAHFPASSSTSIFHSGATDGPTVVVAFNRPVVDPAAATPSISVSGAAVASIAPHLVAGEPANAYLLTLTPDGDSQITVSLLANKDCASGGICAADGTELTAVPTALAIVPPVTVQFASASDEIEEGGSVEVTVELSAAHRSVRALEVPVTHALGAPAGQHRHAPRLPAQRGARVVRRWRANEATDRLRPARRPRQRRRARRARLRRPAHRRHRGRQRHDPARHRRRRRTPGRRLLRRAQHPVQRRR